MKKHLIIIVFLFFSILNTSQVYQEDIYLRYILSNITNDIYYNDVMDIKESKSDKIFNQINIQSFIESYKFNDNKLIINKYYKSSYLATLNLNNNELDKELFQDIDMLRIYFNEENNNINKSQINPYHEITSEGITEVNILIYRYDSFNQAKKAMLLNFLACSSLTIFERNDYKGNILGDYCWHTKKSPYRGGSIRIIYTNLNIFIGVQLNHKNSSIRSDILVQKIAEDVLSKLDQWPSESENFIYRYYNKAKEIIKK